MTDRTEASGVLDTDLLTLPKGRYEKYEAKIRRIFNALTWIRRHRIAICITIALLAIAVLLFLFCIGIFIGDVSCEDFTYGDSPAFSAKAFMTDVRYQYAVDDNPSQWSDTVPSQPGNYLIRGVTQNPFGMMRYSPEASFVLLPRKLTIAVDKGTCVYGDLTEDYLSDKVDTIGLVKGDRVEALKFHLSAEIWDQVDVSVISYRIVNADGGDVTAAYDVTTQGETITVLPRPITLSTNSDSKVYDGTPWSGASATITQGSLVQGDELHYTFPAFSATVGSYTVPISSYAITDSNGEDVTYKYSLTIEHGIVQILARPLIFTTGSAEKIYDQTPLTNPQWQLMEGTLADGHTLSTQMTSSRVIVGESLNELSVLISDSQGIDVTSNYNIQIQAGKLKIHPIVLKFKTDSAEKMYDGQYLVAKKYELLEGSLLPSHRMFCETRGSLINVGVRDNPLFVEIYDSGNHAVTAEGYEIVVECGTLKVTPRPLTVTSGSAEKLYDGTPLKCEKMTVTEGKTADTDTNLKAYYTGSQTKVGQSLNTFNLQIFNSGNENVTANYNLTYVYGTLTVLPNDNFDPGDDPDNPSSGPDDPSSGPDGDSSEIIPGSGIQIGFPQNDEETIYARIEITYGLAAPYRAYLRITSYGDYTGSGFAPAKPYTQTIYNQYISSLDFIGRNAVARGESISLMHIERLSGCPVLIPYYSYDTQQYFGQSDTHFISDLSSYKYEFVQIPELVDALTLPWTKTDVEQELAYRESVYKEYLQIPDTTKKDLLRIAAQNGIKEGADLYDMILQIQKYIKSAASYNLYADPYPEGVDVAVYFLEVAKEGICQHYAAAATMMYRAFGIPARFVGGFVKETNPGELTTVTSQDAHAWVEIYLDGIGWVPVEVTGSGLSIPPTVKPTEKIELVIASYSASKEYDGQPFGPWESEKFNIIQGQLLPGHTISVTMVEMGLRGSIPGAYMNDITQVVIRDENGKDVTDEFYSVITMEGHMIIQKRKLIIQMGSASKVADGVPLTCNEWWIASGNLLPDHYLSITSSSSKLTIGTVPNNAHVSIYQLNSWGEKKFITDCYDITVLPGTLEVTPK